MNNSGESNKQNRDFEHPDLPARLVGEDDVEYFKRVLEFNDIDPSSSTVIPKEPQPLTEENKLIDKKSRKAFANKINTDLKRKRRNRIDSD